MPKTKKETKTPIIAKNDTTSQSPEKEETTGTEQKTKQTKIIKTRSRAYKAAKTKIDVSAYYPLGKAIQLVKDTSLSKFDGKVEAHLVTSLTPGKIGEITFPYLKTESKKVVIANDKLVEDIKAGKIEFDVLIATPSFMPKIMPLARTLGPKGLLPNPKNGTLTDKPEEALKKLATAATVISTEKKAPLVHAIVGSVSQPLKELEANINELTKIITPIKIKKLVLTATMGPAVKVEV